MRGIIGVSAVLLCVTIAVAQAPDPSLRSAMAARNAAQWTGNAQEWGKYTTDDFLAIGADGAIKTKAQRMQEIKGTKINNPAQPVDEIFRSYGTTVIRTWRTNPENGHAMRFSEIWVNQNGAWKVASVHMSPLGKS